MKERSPSYYAAFHCLAGACPHTCCAAGWEIPLDRETALRYESLPGTLGERLRGVLRRDAAGEACLDLHGAVCPFLDREGLCELQRQWGQAGIGEICRSHPRYSYDFGPWREVGLCGSCPEAARLILASPPRWVEREVPEEAETAPRLLKPLLAARETALNILTFRDIPLRQRMQGMLLFTNEVQVLLDEEQTEVLPRLREIYETTLPLVEPAALPDPTESLCLCLDTLEGLQQLWPRWGELLERGREALKKGRFALPEEAGERVCVYFLSRHWLRGVWDGDLLSWAQFAVLGTAVSALLAPLEEEGFCEVFRLFCEELEHSEENMAAIQNAFWKDLSLARLLAVAGGAL